METEAPPASTGDFSDAGNAGSRYDALLRQIVQLNTDLQKTAALSQTLQRERDDTQQHNVKLKSEVKRLNERCDKLQLVLMQETEQKIDADRKHEELIGKWKKQLEVKARAFETLQKKFAPPRDLEQLRIKIQEELEGPYQQRIESLQDEVEQHRQMSFDIRREFEALKAEYEQFSIDQGNEMECIQETYDDRINELALKLQAAEAAAQKNSSAAAQLRDNDSSSTENSLLLKAREEDVEKYRGLIAEAEKKVAAKEEALRQCQHEADETIHKLQMEKSTAQKMVQALEAEKEGLTGKQTASHELITRVKSECVALRTKLKEIENDYRTLQAKHREVIQYQEDVQLENEEIRVKLKYMEQDYTVLTEKLEKEKESHATTARDLHRKCLKLENDFRTQRTALQHETRTALSKTLRELSKTQKVGVSLTAAA
ncbi:hypothetical protein BBO99_00003037 [Phytophthora kernoviae]|uniref:Uncharacterized protein n=2 Tax=Phytophthora kernoviae TaxID=325452 RepID=A0A421GUZ4_9STRA|nr:hypothetical protein G195_003757 [Phytophthora kernoviae 00238/432]KAG2528918.1 hypothetical protein JM16_000980 [Phytophthora kernoviae]KAG2530213.1 hypothetical protein JM18_001061 [Phytophthora kernoviae]RLN06415.1 hypothetical protein BBI17_003185 [Phytophthora kernoviae]RLN82251.1 hypothetical protein BBO99_00003037 [Phytophthora kernoviae]